MIRFDKFPWRPLLAAQFFPTLCAFFLTFAFPAGALIAREDSTSATGGKVRVTPQTGTASEAGPEGEEHYFFGSRENFEQYNQKSKDTLFDNAFARETESSGVQEENQGQDGKWLEEDISPLFPELKVLDDVSSESSLKRMDAARRQYKESLQTLRAGEIAALAEKEKRRTAQSTSGEQWREDEWKERVERHMEGVRSRYRAQAVGRLVKAIQLLDSIQNPSVLASDTYLELKSNVYRQYVKQQFKSRNLQYCVEILEAYLKLRPQNGSEAEAHRLLAACYRHQEVISERMQDHPGSREFKKKKNSHLIKYALLAYGAESPEYAAIERNVQRDLIENYARSE
jgi:hypothetical protein